MASEYSWYRPPSNGGSIVEGDPRTEQVVPTVFGRARVRPVPIYNRVVRTTNEVPTWRNAYYLVDESPQNMSQSVDCVLAICQTPASLQGVWWGKEYVGLRWDGSSWTSVAPYGSTVWMALRRLSSYTIGGHWNFANAGASGSPTWVTDPGSITAAGHELITSTVSPFGKRYVNGPGSGAGDYADITGTYPAWSYLTGAPAGEGFYGLTHLRLERLASADGGAHVKSIEFLMDGVGSNPANPKDLTYSGIDCRPDTAIRWLLVNKLGIPTANVITDVGPDGLYASSLEAWLTAMPDLRCNGVISDTPQAVLDSLLEFAHAELVYSGGQLKVFPLGDLPVGSYVPSQWDNTAKAWTPVVLDRNEVDGKLISASITEDTEIRNAWPVKYKDRAKDFTDNTITYIDDLDAGTNGRKTADIKSSPWVSSTKGALLLSQFLCQRSLNQRTKVNLRVSSRWVALEPGDLISVGDGTYSSGTGGFDNTIGVPPTLLRISAIDEAEDGSYDIEAWEWSSGAMHPIDLTPEQPAAPQSFPNTGAASTAQVIATYANTAAGTAQSFAVNLCGNPNGEVGTQPTGAAGTADGWSAADSGGSPITIDSIPASWVAGGFGTTDRCLRWSGRDAVYGQRVPVSPGDKIYVHALIENHSAAGPTVIAIGVQDGNGTEFDWPGLSLAVGAGWRTLDGSLTVPAGGRYARLLVINQGNTGETDAREVSFRRADPTAEDALKQLSDIASDNILSPVEKPTVIRDYSVITTEQSGIDAQATAAGVTTEKTAYDAAVSALTTYLGTLTAPTAWNDTSGSTTIVGTTFRTKFSDVYTAKQALLNAISTVKAKTDLTNVSDNMVLVRHFGDLQVFNLQAAGGSYSTDTFSIPGRWVSSGTASRALMYGSTYGVRIPTAQLPTGGRGIRVWIWSNPVFVSSYNNSVRVAFYQANNTSVDVLLLDSSGAVLDPSAVNTRLQVLLCIGSY